MSVEGLSIPHIVYLHAPVLSKLTRENHNCLSLPTTEHFFENLPTEEQKRLRATHTMK